MQHPVIYLHIGAPKTGTTYLQNVLWRNRERLRTDGLLYPGRPSPITSTRRSTCARQVSMAISIRMCRAPGAAWSKRPVRGTARP